MVSMNRLSSEKRTAVVAALVEGNSIRATVRMTGVAKNTVAKLLVELGAACLRYSDETLQGLTCKRIQADEIWSFCYAKQKNVRPDMLENDKHAGDVWTWVAMDADTKLVAAWMVGPRDAGIATYFLQDLAGRLKHRVQLTTDGHRAYLSAVEDSFGGSIDYAQLVKLYGPSPEGERRYSPAECTGCRREVRIGDPDPKHISTSYIERQNLTMRMSMRRFTRLTNGFSKKIENHIAAISLHFFHYNFVRIHKTLRVTPAMAAGVTDRLWGIEDIVALLEESENSN